MSEVWVTADLHLGHAGALRFRPFASLEDHDAAVLAGFRRVVRDDDLVYVLGDVALNARGLALAAALPGRRVLVAGNHDTFPAARYLAAGFADVRGVVDRHVPGAGPAARVLLSHVPVHPGQLARFRRNVHGHTHRAPDVGPGYVSVSLERTGYVPVRLADAAAAACPLSVEDHRCP